MKKPHPQLAAVGRNLSRARKAAGHSRADLARQIHATPLQIRWYETGRSDMGVARLIRLSMVLNLRDGQLMDDVCPPPDRPG